jgi:hypothetical protein
MADLLVISPGGRRKRPDLGPLSAAERYDGPHHRLVMAGVARLRAAGVAVEVQFLSPKWGLIGEAEPLLDYDLSLDAMGRAAAAAHFAGLGLPQALAAAVGRAPLSVLLLPGKYLVPLRGLAPAGRSSQGLPSSALPAGQQPVAAAQDGTVDPLVSLLQPPPGSRVLAFVAPAEGALAGPGLTSIPCDPALTRTYHAPNTALKGRLFQALAEGIARDPAPALHALRADPTPETTWHLIDQGHLPTPKASDSRCCVTSSARSAWPLPASWPPSLA